MFTADAMAQKKAEYEAIRVAADLAQGKAIPPLWPEPYPTRKHSDLCYHKKPVADTPFDSDSIFYNNTEV